jgi:hypothetical protein
VSTTASSLPGSILASENPPSTNERLPCAQNVARNSKLSNFQCGSRPVQNSCNPNVSAAPRHPAQLLVIQRSSSSSSAAPRHPALLLVIQRSSSSSSAAPRHPALLLVIQRCSLSSSAAPCHPALLLVIQRCSLSSSAAPRHPAKTCSSDCETEAHQSRIRTSHFVLPLSVVCSAHEHLHVIVQYNDQWTTGGGETNY